jgi:hypothetical protein
MMPSSSTTHPGGTKVRVAVSSNIAATDVKEAVGGHPEKTRAGRSVPALKSSTLAMSEDALFEPRGRG